MSNFENDNSEIRMKRVYFINFIRIFVLIIVVFSEYTAMSVDDSTKISEKAKKILLGKIDFSESLSDLSYYKVEAALSLAYKLTGKYELIPSAVRDSAAKEFMSDSGNTAINLAKHFGAETINFVKIKSFKNMLMSELIAVSVNDSNRVTRANSFALMKYKNPRTDEIMYDPSLLELFQRAVPVVIEDSAVYSEMDDVLEMYPAPTLVVGSILFIENKKLPKWELFEDKQVISFDAVETIFASIYKSPKWVVYDTETRDSVYSFFNLFLPENYVAPSLHEIEALSKFSVEYFITGNFKRVQEGGFIELILSQIVNGRLMPIKKTESYIYDDKLELLRVELQKLSRELIGYEPD